MKKETTKKNEATEVMDAIESEEGTGTIEREVQMAVKGLASVSGKLKEDIIKLEPSEIRFIVDAYYQKQDDRKTKFHQIRAIEQGGDVEYGHQLTLLQWLANSSKNEEAQIKKLLDKWTSNNPIGRYLKDIVGIGPVFSAAMLAYFDVSKANYYGNFTSYAGLNDNNIKWLGSEKANKLVTEVFEKYKAKMELIKEAFFVGLDRDKLEKAIKTGMKKFSLDEISAIVEDDIYEIGDANTVEAAEKLRKKLDSLNFLKNEEEVCEIYEEQFGQDSEFSVILPELFLYIISNGSAVSDWIITTVASKSHRKFETILKGLTNLVKTRKKQGKYFTKTDLASYMARPPYNIKLKVIMYLIGDSFMKRSNHPDSLYGRLYKERKAYELFKNERGDYKKEAARALSEKHFQNKEVEEIYKSGKLTAGHIDMRARRWAEKIFLSHLFEIMYMAEYHKAPPKVYALSHLEHNDYIPPEVPYSRYIDVPQEYYDMYPEVYEASGRIKKGAVINYVGAISPSSEEGKYWEITDDWNLDRYIHQLDEMQAEEDTTDM